MTPAETLAFYRDAITDWPTFYREPFEQVLRRLEIALLEIDVAKHDANQAHAAETYYRARCQRAEQIVPAPRDPAAVRYRVVVEG